jgi:hypothetical protein
MKQAGRSGAECIGRNEVAAGSRGRVKPTDAVRAVAGKLVRAMCVDKRSLRGAH